MRFFKPLFLVLIGMTFSRICWGSANYEEDLRAQVAQVKKNKAVINAEYFHDMGIIARKADDAGLSTLTAEIIRGLLEDSDAFVQGEIESINSQYEKDSLQASRRIPDLTRYERYFQPSDDFFKTALGRGLNGDLIQFRANAIDEAAKSCAPESLLPAVQAIKRTGLYMTNSPQEIDAMRTLTSAVNACFSWKPEITFLRSQPFETLYEKGLLVEESHLRLESSRSDLTQARWAGEWVYRYTGREGKGEGVSQAVLTYHKGEDLATLVISTSRVSSTGRMNFPNSYSGEKRTLDVSGTPLHPQFIFFGKKMDVTGPEPKK